MAPTTDRPAGTLVDHHVHVFSPESKALLEGEIGRELPPFTVNELSAVLDEDQVRAAAILSVGYLFDHGEGEESRRRLSQENDWVAQQLATAPTRLVGMFSINPLSPYAEDELNRCVASGVFAGLKLHLANSRVQLDNSVHARRLAYVLRLATEARLPVVVHLRTDADSYGAEQVRVFLDDVLSDSNECSLQVAHASGWGGYDDVTAAALDELVRAVGSGRFPNLQIDLSAVVRTSRRTAVWPNNSANLASVGCYSGPTGRTGRPVGTSPTFSRRSRLQAVSSTRSPRTARPTSAHLVRPRENIRERRRRRSRTVTPPTPTAQMVKRTDLAPGTGNPSPPAATTR